MTQKNSLMEWLEQTRRISKSVDIICCETIDGIIDVLPSIKRSVIYENRDFFNRFCVYYHKDNPVDLYRIARKKKSKCESTSRVVSMFAQGSITRCWHGIEMVRTAWMEVVDYFWERPELVKPELLDDYVRSQISEVCKEKNKKNPLDNGMWKHFGKHWWDGKSWREERRKRF